MKFFDLFEYTPSDEEKAAWLKSNGYTPNEKGEYPAQAWDRAYQGVVNQVSQQKGDFTPSDEQKKAWMQRSGYTPNKNGEYSKEAWDQAHQNVKSEVSDENTANNVNGGMKDPKVRDYVEQKWGPSYRSAKEQMEKIAAEAKAFAAMSPTEQLAAMGQPPVAQPQPEAPVAQPTPAQPPVAQPQPQPEAPVAQPTPAQPPVAPNDGTLPAGGILMNKRGVPMGTPAQNREFLQQMSQGKQVQQDAARGVTRDNQGNVTAVNNKYGTASVGKPRQQGQQAMVKDDFGRMVPMAAYTADKEKVQNTKQAKA
jgi:hypothetical protein